MKTFFQHAAILSSALLLATAAQATPLVYDWSSTVTQELPGFGLHAGDKITGTLSFDLSGLSKKYSTYNMGNDAGYQYYNTPSTSTTLKVGDTETTVNLYAMVVNNFQMWGGDELFFRADNTAYGNFELQFLDTSMTALGSLEMPTSIDALKFGNGVYLTLSKYPTYARNTLSTFAPASADVPEPATLALFGVALASLAVAQRRRMR